MFDGYANEPTIKDVTHLRVAGGCAAPTVHVSEQTPLCLQKETFLANMNKHAKQQLGDGGLLNHTCEGGADTLIVKTAMDCAELANTVLVGGGMDRLVLLCYHAYMNSKYLFFPPKPEANCTKFQVCDIKKTND